MHQEFQSGEAAPLATKQTNNLSIPLQLPKKWMRERLKQGHMVSGQKYRIYSNGDIVNCGCIKLTDNNKSFVVNTKQTKPGY